jgi:hypothetical protein
VIHESVGNPSSKLPRGVRRGSTTGLQGMERMSLGGELVLVSACLTVTPPITRGQEQKKKKNTHTHCLIAYFFLNELPLIRTQEDNLTGLRTITKKAVHMLSGQRQVSMQEAVHMVDNQELVMCSDMFTYVSLAQGQTL